MSCRTACRRSGSARRSHRRGAAPSSRYPPSAVTHRTRPPAVTISLPFPRPRPCRRGTRNSLFPFAGMAWQLLPVHGSLALARRFGIALRRHAPRRARRADPIRPRPCRACRHAVLDEREKSLFRRSMMGWVSGSPRRQLNSSTLTPPSGVSSGRHRGSRCSVCHPAPCP